MISLLFIITDIVILFFPLLFWAFTTPQFTNFCVNAKRLKKQNQSFVAYHFDVNTVYISTNKYLL